jgi:hypothetical protein
MEISDASEDLLEERAIFAVPADDIRIAGPSPERLNSLVVAVDRFIALMELPLTNSILFFEVSIKSLASKFDPEFCMTILVVMGVMELPERCPPMTRLSIP